MLRIKDLNLPEILYKCVITTWGQCDAFNTGLSTYLVNDLEQITCPLSAICMKVTDPLKLLRYLVLDISRETITEEECLH